MPNTPSWYCVRQQTGSLVDESELSGPCQTVGSREFLNWMPNNCA